VPFDLRNTEAGQAFPDRPGRGHSALAVLGGEMSANDPLPSLRQAEDLIRQAMAAGKPVIGHCLGGQLMARALGARVVDSPAPEVGWQPLDIADSDLARATGSASGGGHGLPVALRGLRAAARRQLLAGSAACPHQAFAIGPHLGDAVPHRGRRRQGQHWSHEHSERWLQRRRPCRHGAGCQALRDGLPSSWPRHQALADRLYARAGWRRCPAGRGVTLPASRHGPFAMRNSVRAAPQQNSPYARKDFTMWNAAAKSLILNEQV
jgi:GMP synthase (glutamine-hydrolysing)